MKELPSYILLKDLPEAKANIEYLLCGENSYYVSHDIICENPEVAKWGVWVKSVYPSEYIKTHSDWWMLKEEKLTVSEKGTALNFDKNGELFSVEWSGKLYLVARTVL